MNELKVYSTASANKLIPDLSSYDEWNKQIVTGIIVAAFAGVVIIALDIYRRTSFYDPNDLLVFMPLPLVILAGVCLIIVMQPLPRKGLYTLGGIGIFVVSGLGLVTFVDSQPANIAFRWHISELNNVVELVRTEKIKSDGCCQAQLPTQYKDLTLFGTFEISEQDEDTVVMFCTCNYDDPYIRDYVYSTQSELPKSIGHTFCEVWYPVSKDEFPNWYVCEFHRSTDI